MYRLFTRRPVGARCRARAENPSLARPRLPSILRESQSVIEAPSPEGGPKSNADTKSIATSDWARPKNTSGQKTKFRPVTLFTYVCAPPRAHPAQGMLWRPWFWSPWTPRFASAQKSHWGQWCRERWLASISHGYCLLLTARPAAPKGRIDTLTALLRRFAAQTRVASTSRTAVPRGSQNGEVSATPWSWSG